MKKLISIVLFLTLFISQGVGVYFTSAYSSFSSTQDEEIVLKEQLGEKKWLETKTLVDNAIKKVSGNEPALLKIEEKLKAVQSKLYQSKTWGSKEEIIFSLSNYILIQVEDSLALIEEQEQLGKIQELIKGTLSETEKIKSESAILEVQKSLIKELDSVYASLSRDLPKFTLNQKQKGSINLSYGINENGETASGSINVNNILAESQGIDAKISGDIKGNFQGSTKTFTGATDIQSLFEVILKDQDLFYLFKDFKTSGKTNSEVAKFIDMWKKMAESNTYIKMDGGGSTKTFPDVFSTKEELDVTFENIKKMFSTTPFFTAYKKDKNTYSLIPSKVACENIKKSMSIISPYLGGECSEEDYNSLLTSFIENNGKLTLTINGDKKDLLFSIGDELLSIKALLSIDKDTISKIGISVTPDQSLFPKEGVKFTYTRFGEVTIYFNADSENIYSESVFTLDSSNKIVKAISKGNINILSWNIDFKEQVLSGKIQTENNVFSATMDGSFGKVGTKDFFTLHIFGKDMALKGDSLDLAISITEDNFLLTGNVAGWSQDKPELTLEFKGGKSKETLTNTGTLNVEFSSDNNKNSGFIRMDYDFKELPPSDVEIKAPTNFKTLEEFIY